LIDDDSWRSRGAVSDEDAKVLVSAEKLLKTQLDGLDSHSELFGFLHGDFHLWNLLFRGDDVAAIDFSDCGWGTYVYDIATALIYLKYPLVGNHDHRRSYERFEEAFLSGYADARPLPDNFDTALPVCFAARMLEIAQWVLCDTYGIDEMPWGPACVAGAVEHLRGYLDT
jgi:Ser/Thr protein kinase RdoA (MazF antagonist)